MPNQSFVIHHWPFYNQSLVNHGDILFFLDFLEYLLDGNLARINENKGGMMKFKFLIPLFLSYIS